MPKENTSIEMDKMALEMDKEMDKKEIQMALEKKALEIDHLKTKLHFTR